MDNFMDKLAQKFSAQEMIKANSQAEAAEIKRLQFQVSEYEKILQEMRRLNYKNTEISEKLDEVIGDSAKKLSGMKEEQQKLVASLRDLAAEQGRSRETELAQREHALMERERAAEQTRMAQERAIEEARLDRERALEEVRQERERAEHERQEHERAAEEARLARERADQAAEEARLAHERADRAAEEARLAHERAEEARLGNEAEEQKANDFDAIAGMIDEKFKYSDDFVHKESVKVYRNVQAVVVDELKQYADNMTAENNKLRAKLGNVMTVSVIAMAASIAGVVISLLTIFGVL